MTYLEYFEAISVEMMLMEKNLSYYRLLHGYELGNPEILARADALNEQYQALLKLLTDGTINPEAEFSPLMLSAVPIKHQ